jgi:hypothetical protein
MDLAGLLGHEEWVTAYSYPISVGPRSPVDFENGVRFPTRPEESVVRRARLTQMPEEHVLHVHMPAEVRELVGVMCLPFELRMG